MLPTPFVFLDTETTGLSMRRDRIIEIGALRVENGKVVKKFQTLLNPHIHLSPYISDMTGILPQEIENAPDFSDIALKLEELLEGAILVAHNAAFDYGFLRSEFLRLEKKWKHKHLCSAKLSRALFPKYKHHNLDSIIERFHINVKNRHRAYDDAKAIWDFFKKVQKKTFAEKFEKAVNDILKHPSLPVGINPILIASLSDNPGVYIFYGENNIPLYVGKSINIKDRVLSHFSNSHKETKEMNISRQITRIESIVTSGELGALLKEAELIKTLQPIYNRRQRESRRMIVVKEKTNKHGYTEVFLQELTTIDPNETNHIITTCKSKKQAKEYLHFLKGEYQLCDKLLGLESQQSASTPCFSYRLGKCKGACVQKENALVYNTRCIIAFSKYKIKPWPFKGPILISEKNVYEKTVDEFWVDKWCLLGKRRSDEYSEGEFEEKDYRFDMDTYKILLRFLRNPTKEKMLSIHAASQLLVSS